MKIILAATEKESTNELALMAIGSYVHMAVRRMDIAALFFPLSRLEENPINVNAVKTLSKKYHIPIGVGFTSSGKEIYRFFDMDERIEIHENESKTVQIAGKPFVISSCAAPLSSSLPQIFLSKEEVELKEFAKAFAGEKETYFLGECQKDVFQVAVFSSRKIKCQLKEDHPNLLAKSVPSSSWDE